MSREKTPLMAMWVSLISNIALSAGKTIGGAISGSQVLVADGVHNIGDVVASFAALVSMKISKQPADEDHPYGHGKAEVVASGAVACVLVVAAGLMGYHSFEAFFSPAAKVGGLAFFIALASLIWKAWLYAHTMSEAKIHKSKSLEATAHDHMADVYASAAAVMGVGAAWTGQRFGLPFLQHADPVFGILVSFMVLKLAFVIGSEAVETLMEKSVDSERLEEYLHLIQTFPQVKRVDRLRARDHGHYVLIDLRIGLEGSLSIQQGHDVSRAIKTLIMENHDDVQEVLIHLNPWYEGEENKKSGR